MKSIVFVTHEFGQFKGHGGVASYLQVLVSQILDRFYDYKVTVITYMYDKKSKLLEHDRLNLIEMEAVDPHTDGKFVLKCLKKIQPNIVETTDYLSLCVEALVYKKTNPNSELDNTTFVTLHHTASRECFEWNENVPIKFASNHIKTCYVREKTQMRLSDLNIAPSTFMNDYVTKNYQLQNVKTILHPLMVEFEEIENIIERVSDKIDIEFYMDKFVITCVSRIEGRKNQRYLIDQFVKFLDEKGVDAYLFIVGNSSFNTVSMEDFAYEAYQLVPERYKNNVLFYGFMGNSEKEKIFAVSDLFVLASTFECLSLAISEAVMYGVPAMCSEYCGFSDYMTDYKEQMIFNPFQENDLKNKIGEFFSFNNEKKEDIWKSQLKGLNMLARYEETVDKRLFLYENYRDTLPNKEGETSLFILINEENYLQKIPESILVNKYVSFVVEFYLGNKLNDKIVDFFSKLEGCFGDGEVVGYTGNFVCEYVNDLLVNRMPFAIMKAEVQENWKDKNYIDIIGEYLSTEKPVYNILSADENLNDIVSKKLSTELLIKYEKFCKKLISRSFINEYRITLEDYI